jgi:ABC-type transport system substrate-binding protein
MLRTGEADVARISREGIKEALGAGLNVVNKENGGVVTFYLTQSWTSPIFSDIRFRKALNLAIDKEAIIKQLFAGMAKPIATYPGPKIFAVGGDLTLKPYPYSPQEARRLIKEGGWEGHEVSLISYDRAGCPEFPRMVEAIAGYWEKVGLKPRIRVTEWNVWRSARFEPKGQNSIYGTDDTLNPEAGSLLIKFKEKFSSKSKISTVNILELNEKIDRIEKSLDIAEVSKLMAEIYRYAYDQYLMIPICETLDQIATTPKISKWDLGLRRMDRNYYELIRQR